MATKMQSARAALTRAIAAFDNRAIDAATAAIVELVCASKRPVARKDAEAILASLRSLRRFDLLGQVADVLIHSGQASAQVRRQYAQALLDQGHYTAAIAVLKSLVRIVKSKDPNEYSEASGLLGRAYKQLYMNARGHRGDWLEDALRASVRCYYRIYKINPQVHVWHGINAAALARRARLDGIAITGVPKAEIIAESVLEAVSTKIQARTHHCFDLATAAEASLALGNLDAAVQWIQKFASDPSVDAFALGSFERQLTEVWQLNPANPPGSQILPLVRTRLLNKQQGVRLTVEPDELQETLQRAHAGDELNLQKVLGKTGVQSYRWWLQGLERASCVARIGLEAGSGDGTGFLIPGRDINPAWSERSVLVTNAHVLSDDLSVNALRSDEAVITFEALANSSGAAPEYSVAKVLKTSPPGEYDYTVVDLVETPPAIEAYPIHSRLPSPGSRSRVYVIGHPRGGTLSFSLQDNTLIDHDAERLVHYRAPTEPGSSGSPVFNAQWKLIALHHAGGSNLKKLNGKAGVYAANEGIWIEAIKRHAQLENPALPSAQNGG